MDLTPLKVSQDFRLLFVGQAISEFGTQITFVVVPFQVYERTGSTAMVGLLALTELIPLVVLPIVGGTIADAVERRRLLMIAHAVTAILSVALAVNAFLPEPVSGSCSCSRSCGRRRTPSTRRPFVRGRLGC
jgi:MFS family permease